MSVAKEQWFVDMLKYEENKNQTGRDSSSGTWVPHISREGGSATIGYGHKVIPSDYNITILGKTFNLFTDRVPDKYIDALLLQDIIRKEKSAERQLNEHNPNGLQWRDLNPLYRAMLTEINFNAKLVNSKGKWGWPKLTKAMKAESSQVFKELDRYFVDSSGDKKPLKSRVKRIAGIYRQSRVKQFAEQPALQKAINTFPGFEQLNSLTKTRLLSKIIKEEADKKEEEERKAKDLRTLLTTVKEEADERDRQLYEELQETERAREAEEPPQREEAAEVSVKQDEGKIQVSDEPLSKIEYFQKPDGSVVKVDNGNMSEVSWS